MVNLVKMLQRTVVLGLDGRRFCWWYFLVYYCSMGLDLINGTVRNNLEAGVIEPAMSKVKIIQVRAWQLERFINLSALYTFELKNLFSFIASLLLKLLLLFSGLTTWSGLLKTRARMTSRGCNLVIIRRLFYHIVTVV